ncbi:MAG: CBS domain-containing protein [Deltaproteobacteria bacterium]|nr:CBS domain-containing protein [Deltaproteobacteria bacterium]
MKIIKDILEAKGHEVYTISPDATVYEALSLMAEKNVGALVILEGETLEGLISERDYARKIILKGKFSEDTPVREIMSGGPVTVTIDDDLEQCMELMTDKRVRHLPVVEEGRLIGIISIGDVVKGIIDHKEFIIQQLEKYIKGQQ